MKPPRRNELPEHTDYRDTGCDLFEACLSCPLPQCRYEMHGASVRMLNQERNRAIHRRRREGATIVQVAREFGVTTRTVHRVLRRG